MTSDMRELSRRLLAFGSLPLLSSLAPMLLLPLLARSTGAAGWTGLLVSQSLGAFSAVVIQFGWGVSGQARAALATSDAERSRLYRESLRTRGIVALVVVPIGATLTHFLTSGTDDFTNVGMYLAASAAGMTLAWFAIGLGRARWIATFEAIPKLLATIVSVPLVILLRDPWPYPVLLLVGTAVGLLAFSRRFAPDGAASTIRADFSRLRSDAQAAVSAIAGSAYAAAPLPIAALFFSESQVAGTASIDRLYRYGLFAVSALGNAMLSWTLGHAGRRRRLIAIAFSSGLGLIGGLFLALLGPFATQIAFGAHVAGDPAVASWYGVAYLAVSAATPLVATVLIPAGRAGAVVRATVISAIVGIGAMVLFPRLLGVSGVSAGFAVSEALSLALLVTPAARVLVLRARGRSSNQRSTNDASPSGGGEGDALGVGHPHRHTELPLPKR